MDKATVFGGSGFLGSHVADELTARGFEVKIFDIVNSPYLQSDKQEMIVGDLLSYDDVLNATKGSKYVFHFAGQADIGRSKEKPLDTIQQNILGTTNVLEACRATKVSHFFFASSIYVYSEFGSIYKSSKQACEILIESYEEEYGLKSSILRYGSLYGKRANGFNFIHQAIKSALEFGVIERIGKGDEVREYIHVVDAAKITVDLIEKNGDNRHFIITGHQSIRVNEMLTMIKEMLGSKVEIKYSEGKMDGHYFFTPYTFKPRVARKIIPTDIHDLGQGILDTIYEVYENLDEDLKHKVNIK